jgi:hypothetical protein
MATYLQGEIGDRERDLIAQSFQEEGERYFKEAIQEYGAHGAFGVGIGIRRKEVR